MLCVVGPAASAGTAEDWQETREAVRVLQRKGALREAQQRLEAALPELRRSNRPGLGVALDSLSDLASSQGAYDLAIARAREAAEVFRSLGDRPGEELSLYLTGVAELYQAHYASALGHLREGLALAREKGDRDLEIEALNNIGTVHYVQAGYLEALRTYREALGVLDLAKDQPSNARLRRITLTNLAVLFQRLGQDEQALKIYGDLRKGPEALDASEQARVLSNLGVLYRRLGDPLKALETYRAAQKLLAGDQHTDARIGVLSNIGIVQALDMGDLPAALTAFTDALALAQHTGNRREVIEAHLYRGEALYRQGDAAGSAREFEAAIAGAKQLGTTEEEWKGLYGLGRLAHAGGRDEVAMERFREAVALIESVRERIKLSSLKTDFLANKRDVYDALLEILLQRQDGSALFEVLEKARSRAFQDRLSVAPPSLASVQQRLAADTLLLEYWAGPHSAAVLWVRHGASGLAALPSSAVDPQAISALLEAASSGSGEEWKSPAAALGAQLLGPALRDLPAEIRHVIVVADGPLGAVPFALLDAGGGSPLIARFDVSYLPTSALLGRAPPAARRWAPPWAPQLVVFADPQVVGSTGGAGPHLGGAELGEPLVGAREEAEAIAQSCPGRARLYLGASNLKRHLLQGAATGVPLLHLATHAVADVLSPERSRILFSPARAEDGADFLFLKEVYDLDLRGVDLATLSACDSERGKLVRGEGPQAFSRALLSAGARATVTTLWRVSDEPTRDFMKQFYFELNRGETKAQALRLAKLRFLRSGSALAHPRYWAAFVLTGEGLTSIPPVLSWSRLLAAGGFLLAAAVAGLHLSFNRPRRLRRSTRRTPSGDG